MINVDQHHLNTPHGNIEFLDVGSGSPVLYLHGTGAGNDAALLLEQSLLKSDCRLIAPNRPGYGRTAIGHSGSAEFCADLAAELLDHLAIKRAVVIGTSGGGMLAACFARCYPSHTAALVLQCAQSHRWDDAKWLPTGFGPALFLFRHRFFKPFLQWQNTRHAKSCHRHPIFGLRHMSGSRFAEIRDDPDAVGQVTALASMTLRCAAAPAGIQNDWAIMVGDNGITADTIRCRTLIIHDQADPLVPFLHAEWSQSSIPQSRLLAIQSGGHLIWFGKDSAFMHTERAAFIRESIAA
jgi:pimeloyl-ACP methyl ester carboxylesterase